MGWRMVGTVKWRRKHDEERESRDGKDVLCAHLSDHVAIYGCVPSNELYYSSYP